jgi:hypothetical protein
MHYQEWIKKIKRWFAQIESLQRGKASEMHEWEEKELRNMFALMVVGPFAGIPSPPLPVTLELLPEMEEDLVIMMNRIQTAHDPMGELFSLLDPV